MSTRPLVRSIVVIELVLIVLAGVFVTLHQIQSVRAGRSSAAADYTVGGPCGATIQACINNPIVVNGDRILIPAGTYTESLTLNKAVSLIGAGADTTIVHAISGQRVMTVTGSVITASTIIAGLTFTGGNLTGGFGCPMYCGGGLRITEGAQPLLLELVIDNNHTDFIGGGLYADGKLTLISAVFMNNTANNSGGGLTGDDTVTLVDTVFIGNSARDGGGASLLTATLTRVRFENNSSMQGGGLAAGDASIAESKFISNTASYGGGGLFVAKALTLTNSVFLSNAATNFGGGLEHYPDPTFIGPRPARIVNTIFANNHASDGAALFLASLGQATILHATIADQELNSGTAIVIQGGALGITDTIITSHTIGIDSSRTIFPVYEDYNLLFHNTTPVTGTVSGGSHDVSGDPHFLDPSVANYHIVSPSAAINAGVNAGVFLDIDNQPRPANLFDIGADEYWAPGALKYVYLPLIRKN